MAKAGSLQSAYPAVGASGSSVSDAFFAEETLGIKGKSAKQQHSLRGGSAVNYTKLFDDFIHLAETDHVTFFTVFANHPNLHIAIGKAVVAAEGSISSATKGSHRFTKRQLGALATFAVRALADFSVKSKRGGGVELDPMAYCGRLQLLFPASVWMPLAHLITKVDGQSSSIVFNALGLCCPGTLAHLPAAIMIWCDELHALSQRVISEAKRGRFQRSNGDIVSLFERSFALVQGFWSLLDSNPIAVVPFLPVARVLETLSCHTNIVCPFLQHFLLNCDSLAHHRKQLSNVNSMIMNATVSAASIVVMFYPFKPADVMKEAAARDGLGFSKAVTLRSYTIPSVVETYEEEVIDSLITFLNPLSVPVVLLENSRSSSTGGGRGGNKAPSILQVIDAIAPIQEKDEPSSTSKRRQGKRGANTGAIGEVISDSSIISGGGMSLSDLLMPLIRKAAEDATGNVADGTNFIRALLGELVNQGGGVDEWAARGLINSGDAEQLGSNTSSLPTEQITNTPQHFDSEQDAIDAAIAASMADTGAAAASSAEEDDGLGNATRDEREQIGMILDIAPSLGSPSVALAALRYYNGDLEALLVDATSDNMPPHLLAAASTPPPKTTSTAATKVASYDGAAAASSSSASPAAASSGPSQAPTATKKEGYLNMHAFLFSHWNAYQNDAAEDGEDGDEEHEHDEEEEDGGWEAMATTGAGGGRQVSENLFSSPNDTDMHAITQMLVDQLLYEDERDDGQDYEAEAIIPTRNANHRGAGVARSARSKYGNDDDDDEPLHNNHSHTVVMGKAGSGGGGGGAALGGPATQPRYTTKNKYDSANKRKSEEKKKKTTEEKKEERPTRTAPKSKTGGKQHDRKGGKSSF